MEKKMKMKMIFVIVLLFSAVVIAGCTSNIQNTDNNIVNSEYTNINSEQLSAMMQNKDFTLIDVHVPEQEHISGTDLVIPFDEIMSNLDKLPQDKDAKIVIYCRSGSMSKTASEALVKEGYTNVYNLVDGRNEWVAKGYDI